MKASTRRLIGFWLLGPVVGTAIIAVTSPLFVRSYLPLQVDPVRGVWTLPDGTTYRWRSEGYADTQIGPLGMPGKTEILPPSDRMTRIALWGDSQAEGVCVADAEKIFAQCEKVSESRMQVFPLARSGESAAEWLTQMRSVETELQVEWHVLFVVDLDDLLSANLAPLPPPENTAVESANRAIASWAPAFVIQGARHVLTEDDGATRRRLRFSIGPVDRSSDEPISVPLADPAEAETEAPLQDSETANSKPTANDWRRASEAIRRSTDRPVLILYAPVAPQIVGGHVVDSDELNPDSSFQQMRAAAQQAGLFVVSAGELLRASADRGEWPHGFQNGQIGSGHLNRIGNRIVAEYLVSSIQGLGTRDNLETDTPDANDEPQGREGD